MRVYYDPVQKNHTLAYEIVEGKRLRHHERRARVDVILKHLRNNGGFEFIVPEMVSREPILAVHDESYVTFLESTKILKKDEIIWPYVFPCDGRLPVREPVTPFTAGHYCFDVGTPIMGNTWDAALAAVSSAAMAATDVRKHGGSAFALCRPPGHHASSSMFGGYCYLNNAAVAARYLSQYGKVLIIDFDFHHGNGTQSIFYDDPTVFYLSLHGHPKDQYPYFTGWENERGIDDGLGFNLNLPIERFHPAEEYLKSMAAGMEAAIKVQEPAFLVVSCGFDIADQDPLGHFRFLPHHFQKLGNLFSSLRKPTVLVQEGGYLVEKLGINVESFLCAFL